MPEVTESAVRGVLETVMDPVTAKSVVASGMISGIATRGGHVAVTLEVDPSRGPSLEPLRLACEQAVRAMPGVLSATAVLTAERAAPAPPPMPAERRVRSGPVHRSGAPGGGRIEVPGVKHIIAIASGKGGVGKSTTAVNLALGLAAIGVATGLLDADIYGPSMPRMLAVTEKPESADGKQLKPIERYGLRTMSIGYIVNEETPMIWRGPMVSSALEQMLRDVQWAELDVLVVDMPPGTGDAQLTLAQRVALSGAVIVSTPQDIALVDARKGLNMFRKVAVPVLGIVENMSYFVCPKCGERSEIFGHGGAHEEADRLGVPFLGEIPLHLDIRTTSDSGHPIVVAQPDSPHAQAYKNIAGRVWKQLTAKQRGPRAAPRIVMR
ncbi:iron-sulfur cluster carrier protein ApbC [Reyranella sp.]|jgi:ATP-binding protein involved in chromosome partitioning|uniref:iron-sulfur cluster carrier protein ApbC n=1 Tax=Reyranella sp. TaxID=1929291 RepID=UPI002F95FE67